VAQFILRHCGSGDGGFQHGSTVDPFRVPFAQDILVVGQLQQQIE
jgi:hypothetical protein